MKLKEIEAKIKEIDLKYKKNLIKYAEGKMEREEFMRLERKLIKELVKLKEKKIELVNAKEFVEFVEKNNLSKKEDVLKAVKLFLKIPLKHRKFVLEYCGFDAWKKENTNDWEKKAYKALKILCRQKNIDLSKEEKAKLVDEICRRFGISAFTLRKNIDKIKIDVRDDAEDFLSEWYEMVTS